MIASVNGGTVQDTYFRDGFEKGPFYDIKSFNGWMFCTALRMQTPPELYDGCYRDNLPDSGKVYFAHGDLTLGNIMVAGAPGNKRIVGIVDWDQAG